MMRKILQNKITPVAVIIATILLGAATASAILTTSYAYDKNILQFQFDVDRQYIVNESMPLSVSMADTRTGQKPSDIAVLMSVNGGSSETILPAGSITSSRFVNLDSYNLPVGSHHVTFTAPGACGNFFDFSSFDNSTRFDNEFACQFRVNFSVANNDSGICTDSAAVNTGEAGGCLYEDRDGCTNPVASNYDPLATNNDGSCVFNVTEGCTDPLASNYVPSAINDDGSCVFYDYGCTDTIALNYDSSATAEDGTCVYDGNIVQEDFECSVNNRDWVECEGRTFSLRSEDTPIYVRTAPANAGVWSDWCTGDLNNGVQAEFDELISNGANAEVNFTFSERGSLFDMVLCLNPDSPTHANSFKNIKLKLLNTRFIEN